MYKYRRKRKKQESRELRGEDGQSMTVNTKDPGLFLESRHEEMKHNGTKMGKGIEIDNKQNEDRPGK